MESDNIKLVEYRGKYAVYWADEHGQSQRRSLGTSDPAEAERRFAEYKRGMDLRRREAGHTIADLWEARRKAVAGRRLAENMGWSGKHILSHFGRLRASQVTKDHIKDYGKARGAAPGTIWTELNHLRMTLSWAKKEGLIADAPQVPLPSRPRPKADYLTKDQARAFLDACDFPHLRLFAHLALATGARRSAILELEWDQVDFERRLINFEREHNPHAKGRGLVPINDTLFKQLTEAHAKAVSKYVIEYSGDRVHSVSKGVKSTGVRAGLPFVSPHVFRHSAAVWMAESGEPMEVIAQFLGHTNPEITRRVYARYSPTYLRSAAKALEL